MENKYKGIKRKVKKNVVKIGKKNVHQILLIKNATQLLMNGNYNVK